MVGPLPTHRLAVRHSVDDSSSDHITSDGSSRDLPSDSSLETSSDSSSDALSDFSSGHSSLDHSSPALSSSMRSSHQLCSSVPSILYLSAAIIERPSHFSSAGPSRKRSRSAMTSVPLSSPIPGALSSTRADLLPPPKRIRSSECDEPHSEPLIDPVETVIEACFDFANIIRDDILEPAQEEGAIEITYETLGDLVQRFHDHTIEILVHRVQAIESIHRDQGHMIVATGQQSVVMSERIRELERDNTRLRDIMDVASQRVNRFQRNPPREGLKPFAVRPLTKLRQRPDLFKSNTHDLPLQQSFPAKVENVVIQDLVIPQASQELFVLIEIRKEDLRTELEYFSEDYDEELEMEPRPERAREVTPPLRMRSPRDRRQRERVVGFEETPNRERGRIRGNTEGSGPLEARVEENGR
ncbi:hypothetical protein Tco_0556793 [Tanacetum coccineum]